MLVSLQHCIQRILDELGSSCNMNATLIFEDNQSCISWVLHLGKRGKHIDVRYHYSRSMSYSGNIIMQYCPTNEMIADIITKALGPQKHVSLKNMFGRLAAEGSFIEEKSCNIEKKPSYYYKYHAASKDHRIQVKLDTTIV